MRRSKTLKDIVDDTAPFDKDNVLRLVPEQHQTKLNAHNTVYATAIAGLDTANNSLNCVLMVLQGVYGRQRAGAVSNI